MGGFVVGKIVLPYDPKWLFNNRRHKKRAKYVKIASKEGKNKALEALENDYKNGMIDYPTYRKIRNFLLYRVREIKLSESEFAKKLLKVLETIASTRTTKLTNISLSVEMNPDEVREVLKWAGSMYPNLLKAVNAYIKKQEAT